MGQEISINDKKSSNAKPVSAAVFMLLIWSIVTLILVISVLGWVALFILLDDEDGWFKIPSRCVDALG